MNSLPLLTSRGGVCDVSTPMLTHEEDVVAYAAAGFKTMGIFLNKLERPRIDEFWLPESTIPQERLDRAAAAVRDAGLTVSHIAAVGRYTDSSIREQMIEHTLHAIDVAAAFDAGSVLILPGPLNGRTPAQTTTLVARTLEEILQRRSSPVRLGLEPTRTWGADFMTSLGEALDLIDMIDHPDLGVIPDTQNLHGSPSYDEDIARAGSRIFAFQVVDGFAGQIERKLPGEGDLPLVEMIRAAEKAGYRGTYDLEHIFFPFDRAASEPDEFGPDAVLRRGAAGLASVLAEAGVQPIGADA